MQRQTTLPFAMGEITPILEITGPVADLPDAEYTLDDIFRKAVGGIMKLVIPPLNNLHDLIEVTETETMAEVPLEIETLGNVVRLTVGIKLSFGVDPDLIRHLVAQYVMADFARSAIEIVTSQLLTEISNDETKAQFKPRVNPLFDMLSGLAGLEGRVIRVG